MIDADVALLFIASTGGGLVVHESS